jgi:hypothetical protein
MFPGIFPSGRWTLFPGIGRNFPVMNDPMFLHLETRRVSALKKCMAASGVLFELRNPIQCRLAYVFGLIFFRNLPEQVGIFQLGYSLAADFGVRMLPAGQKKILQFHSALLSRRHKGGPPSKRGETIN